MIIKLFVILEWNLCFGFTKEVYTNNIYFSVFLGRFVWRVLLTFNIKEFYKKINFMLVSSTVMLTTCCHFQEYSVPFKAFGSFATLQNQTLRNLQKF